MSNLIFEIVQFLFQAYFYAIIFYVVSSWVPPLRESKVGQFVGRIVEPYLGFFRRFIPPLGMIDISPIIAIFVYYYIRDFALVGLWTVLKWFA